MTARHLQETAQRFNGRTAEGRQTLPEYLRQLRVSSHYRQNYVASKLNISRQTYSHYETGRIRPPAGALYGLAKLYGVPVEKLLSCMMLSRYGIENAREEDEGLKQEGPGHGLVYENNSLMEGQLLSCFRSLSERDKEDILSIIKIKTQNKGEKGERDAERKTTV